MEFIGKFSEIKDEIHQYFKNNDSKYIGNDLSRYKVIYMDGKHLNDYRRIEMYIFSQVIFDVDVTYKTWWDTHPRSWYPEPNTLAYVEEDDSNEGIEYRKRHKEINEMIASLTSEDAQLTKAEKMPKYKLEENKN